MFALFACLIIWKWKVVAGYEAFKTSPRRDTFGQSFPKSRWCKVRGAVRCCTSTAADPPLERFLSWTDLTMIESVFPQSRKIVARWWKKKKRGQWILKDIFPGSALLAAGPALYSWAVCMGTAHLLCMCVSGWVLKPDDSALPGSNNEELPAGKINSSQCVRLGLRNQGRI